MKTTAFYTPPPPPSMSAVPGARPAMAGSTLGGILASSAAGKRKRSESNSSRTKMTLANVLLGVESCEYTGIG